MSRAMYRINLAQCVLELHSKGILILNLKQFNVLLNDNDQAILGDVVMLSFTRFLIPKLQITWLQKQWEPEVRGPISFETDYWGHCRNVDL
ncbi:hypothetical protein CR513_11322, partial [Mucuna pruriens]